MKELALHTPDLAACRPQLDELRKLLQAHPVLDEREQVLPFFRGRRDLAMLLGYYVSEILQPNVVAVEFPLYGDFRVDLIVGDSERRHYLLVEFENGGVDAPFVLRKPKTTPEWSPRYEHAFSQLVDWFWKLNEMSGTAEFDRVFGRNASFHGLIVIGREGPLQKREEERLRWRIDHVVIDSQKISSMTFEQLLADLEFRLDAYTTG